MIPSEWLPNGANQPGIYELHLHVDADIDPLLKLDHSWCKIPGCNASVPMSFDESCPWENISRDPVTQEFFLDE